MALKNCNCSVSVEMVDGKEKRTYSLYINNEGEHPTSNEANNLDLDDLKFIERELAKSIELEKMMSDAN